MPAHVKRAYVSCHAQRAQRARPAVCWRRACRCALCAVLRYCTCFLPLPLLIYSDYAIFTITLVSSPCHCFYFFHFVCFRFLLFFAAPLDYVYVLRCLFHYFRRRLPLLLFFFADARVTRILFTLFLLIFVFRLPFISLPPITSCGEKQMFMRATIAECGGAAAPAPHDYFAPRAKICAAPRRRCARTRCRARREF